MDAEQISKGDYAGKEDRKTTSKTKEEFSRCSTPCISEKWGCTLSPSRFPYKFKKLKK